MKLVTYREGEGSSVGVLAAEHVVDLNDAFARMQGDAGHLGRRRFGDVADLLGVDGALEAAAEALAVAGRALSAGGRGGDWQRLFRPLAEVQLLPPVLRPTKVIGVGMNYRSFVEQLGETPPPYPVLFHKTSSALTGAGSPIVIPPVTKEAVPEGELAVVISQRGAFIAPEEAERYIAGYTCANDVSARDLEFRTSQWTSGKMLATFCPLGPALVTPDELRDPGCLELRTVLNGRVIQQGNTRGMLFGLARLISEISSVVTLEAGDVILTGTPSDLGALKQPVFLSPGDVLRVEIEGVGVLENPVISSRAVPLPPRAQ